MRHKRASEQQVAAAQERGIKKTGRKRGAGEERERGEREEGMCVSSVQCCIFVSHRPTLILANIGFNIGFNIG